MNKAKKNIVIVGFTKAEQNSLGIPYIEKGNVYYVNTMQEALKHQGYLLVYDNKENIDLVSFDKKYRKRLRKFEVVWFYNEAFNWELDKFSNIEKVGRDIFYDISYNMSEEWNKYKEFKHNFKNEIKYNQNKQLNLTKLFNYLKNYKTIKTSKICDDLKFNKRSVERYMLDLNKIYHNIGYDCKENEWYLIW